MPEDNEHKERALKLLTQALQEAGIEERNSQRLTFFGKTDVYYRTESNNYIEVEFYSVQMFTGHMRCTLGLRHLSEETARMFPNDAEAVATLVAMLNYLKNVTSGILTATAHKLFERRRNITFKSLSAYQRKNIRDAEREFQASILASIDDSYVEKQRDWEKEFRGIEGRGGSAPKLGASDRRSLHKQYDDVHRLAKPIKKAYNTTFKSFAASRRQTGYNWSDWQEFWIKYAGELYDRETEFLVLFASQDNPSASEIAYRWLAAKTGHTVAYLRRLVTAARKKARPNK